MTNKHTEQSEKYYNKLLDRLTITFDDQTSGHPKLGKIFWSTIYKLTTDRQYSLKKGITLIHSSVPREKFLGVILLGALCNPTEEENNNETEQIIEILIVAAKKESHIAILGALIDAMSYTQSPKTIPTLVQLSTHQDPELRRSVAAALGSVLEYKYIEKSALETLKRLSYDPDDEVRNWAVFTLGTATFYSEIDSEEIRKILLAKLQDSHNDVVQEGLMGLALRNDLRALDFCKQRFTSLVENNRGIAAIDIEIIGLFGSVELFESLQKISAWWDDADGRLTWALARCNPDPKIRDSVPEETTFIKI